MFKVLNMRALLVCGIFLLKGCGSIEVNLSAEDNRFYPDARLKQPASLPPVSLSILRTAKISTLDALAVSGGNWTQTREMSHTAVLVQHPKATLLFDSGLGSQIDTQFKQSMPFWLKPFMQYEQLGTAQSILAAAMPEQRSEKLVDTIILSHLHWDHASGIKDFPAAEIWTTELEYNLAIHPDTEEGPYIREQFNGSSIKWKFLRLKAQPYENFSHSLDVFEDGSIVLVPLPGHTPGAIGMFVNLASGKRIFFTGDTTWTAEGFKKPSHKFWLASMIVDNDRVVTARSILKVHRLMTEYPAMAIVPAHDSLAQKNIARFPEFIH